MPRVGDGFEHSERAPADRIERSGRPMVSGQQITQLAQALFGGKRRPLGQSKALRDHLIMHVGVLRDVQCRQVKGEGAHASNEAPNQEIAGMPSPIGGQTVGRQLDVREQFVRTLICIGPAIVGSLEPFADLTEEDAVRLSVVTRGRQLLPSWKQCTVCIDALEQGRADGDTVRALTQRLCKLTALVEIGRYDQLLMPVQRFANRLTMHIGIAIHVAAHPGPEMQYVRYVQGFGGHRIRMGQRRLDLLIKERDDPVEDLEQVEKYMLTFIGDGEPLPGMVFRLPHARDLQSHPRPQRLALCVRQARIEAIEQILRDVLLFAQDGATRGFRGMRGEHRLDAHRRDQFERLVEG